jgi:hypothetical protein
MDDTELQQTMQERAMLADANARANKLNTLAAVAQMANNPGAAAAAKMAQAQQYKQFAPEKMGQMGYALPGSGDFVESPVYKQEKQATRDAKDALLVQSLQARKDLRAQQEEGLNQRAADANALRQTLAQMSISARAANRVDPAIKAEEKRNKDIETGVTKFAGTLEKAGIPELESALTTAEARLSKHKMGELPGYGRFEGAIPDWAASNEQQMSRSDMQQAANILLKARSGAAVTDPEQQRFLREVASGKGMSEEAMRHGWANLRQSFEAKKANLTSGVSDAVLGEYNNRSPLQLTRAAKSANAGRGGAAPSSSTGGLPAGVTAAEWEHMTTAERSLFQ